MSKESDPKLKKWKEKMLAQHRRMLKHEPQETRELFENVVEETKRGEFDVFITDPNQKNPFGRSIAAHNSQVVTKLSAAGINWKQWLDYKEEEKEIHQEQDHERCKTLWEKLEYCMTNLVFAYEGQEILDSLIKDIAFIRQLKKVIQAGEIKIPDDPVNSENSPFFRTYAKTIAYYKKKRILIRELDYSADSNWGKIHEILREFSSERAHKEYSVRLWSRRPMRDMFQGNFGSCCISVGTRNCYPRQDLRLFDVDYKKYPAGILEFLVDVGIQVAEVIENNVTVGACWLFLSNNEGERADLIVDSADINENFVKYRAEKRAVRACILRFLKNYAAAVGADRILIGKTGPMMNEYKRRPIVIDFETKGLSVVKLQKPINKLGGYFRDKPYFLESRHGIEAFEVR